MIDYDVADGLCVLGLDNPPVNAISFELLDAMTAAVRRANDDAAARAIVITGGADQFSAGADVAIFESLVSDEDAVRTSRVFQDAFGEIERSAKPVAAAVAGKVIGGALELAVACHCRVAAGGAKFVMPEVNLAISPGAGGTQRLPRLVGVEAALRMLLTGGAIGAKEAEELGLVDRVCGGSELVDAARELLAVIEQPFRTCERTGKVDDPAVNAAVFAGVEKLLAEGRSEIIAPRKIVEAVRIGLAESVFAGESAEQRFFAECMATQATRNKLYLFGATRKTAKTDRPATAATARIARPAVVGMGSMGTGIAHAMMIAGLPVLALDGDAAAVEKGQGRIRKSIEKRVAAGKMTAARAEGMLGLLTTTTDWADVAEADLVIEAVFEDIEVKRGVLARIEDACCDDALIATNTSTLSLAELAEGLANPERLVGMHFFNPAHLMPLVEVIHRDATPPDVVAAALGFTKNIRKTPVLVRNREGFLVNRIFIPYLKEAFWLYQEGADPRVIDEAMVEFGFAMGPMTLIDMAGLDILEFTDQVMRRAFPEHGPLSPIVGRLVADGCLGQKTGSGVYRYERGDYTRHHSDSAGRIVEQVRGETNTTPRDIGPDEIANRLVLRMVGEAFYVLAEKLAPRESDIDAASVLGVGFPDFRGGVIRHARDVGLDAVADSLDALARQCGRRFEPCELLRQTKGN